MDKSFDKEVCERVEFYMKKSNLKKSKLAELLEVTPQTIGDIFRNRSPWRINQIVKVALYFNVSLEKLMFNDENILRNIHNKINDTIEKELHLSSNINSAIRFEIIKSLRISTELIF
jgi:transcriptional regulator with XRE-family HTH domain